MQAWTDFVFTDFGDKPDVLAKVREIKLLSYDGFKYCPIMLGDFETELSSEFIYQSPGRRKTVEKVPTSQLKLLNKPTLPQLKSESEIEVLQKQIADIEKRFEPLRENKLYNTQQWDELLAQLPPIRKKLFELTGDAYGRPKQEKQKRPDDDLLYARYDAPGDVPAQVMAWVRTNSSVITSDASDAVRWSRIVDTKRDDRFPAGDVTLYRAIGRGDDIIEEIRPGDWVTTSLEYAQDHLKRWLDGRGSILEMNVDGRDVLASPTGNHEEAIFAPMDMSGPIKQPKKAKKSSHSPTI